MIRFACPSCKAGLELPDNLAGSNFGCPSCSQAIKVPQAQVELKQSFMDRLLHATETAPLPQRPLVFPPPSPAAGVPPPATSIPPMSGSPAPPLRRDALEPVRRDEPARRDDSPRRDETAPPPPPREYYRDDSRDRFYEDDDFDDNYFDRPRRGGRYQKDYAVRSALYGMICSILGAVLILVGLFVWLYSARRGAGRDSFESTLLLLLVLTFVCFILTLLGVVFSGRGMDAANDSNRGVAITGLVLGIVGMVISVIAGFFFLMCGMFVRMLP